jgi:hypothetical protein
MKVAGRPGRRQSDNLAADADCVLDRAADASAQRVVAGISVHAGAIVRFIVVQLAVSRFRFP